MASGWVWTFCFVLCFQSIRALNNFTVGGSKGWHLPSGSESYNLWAGSNRFQIGDTLLFKYDKNVDSVLQVSPEKYKTCNATSPIKSFNDGNTVFKLHQHGAFYFISGNSSNCKKGEKLIVVVLAPCHNGQGKICGKSSSPSPSPRTSQSPTPSTNPSTSPSPSPSPKTSPSPSTSHGSTPTPIPIYHPSLSPSPSISSSPSSSPSAESPQIITPSSSSNYTSPAPAPLHSASSSSATSFVNIVIPLLLVGLLRPNL